jgi:hypothetical protein
VRQIRHARGKSLAVVAVLDLRRAEKLSPLHVTGNPFVRDVLGELLAWSKWDAVGRELRGMACRAGLPM